MPGVRVTVDLFLPVSVAEPMASFQLCKPAPPNSMLLFRYFSLVLAAGVVWKNTRVAGTAARRHQY